MKRIILAASMATLAFLSGCHNADDLKKIEEQAAANDSLATILAEKAQALTEITDAVQEFQTRLSDIKEKQKIVSMNAANPEMSRSQLLSDIDVIAEEMEKNRKLIQSLRYSQSQSKSKLAEYEKLIDALQMQIDQQTEEIARLNEELSKRNVKIAKLEEIVETTAQELDQTKTDLTAQSSARAAAERTVKQQKTAYYVVDTEENLMAGGIINKKGDVVASGSEPMFSTLDKTTEFSIALPQSGRKFKVISKQADNRRFRKSYELDADAKTLRINNPGIFWGADKYLVIMITKTE